MPDNGRKLASAWELDKLFGLRIEQAFPVSEAKPSEPFAVIAAKSNGAITTELGEAEHVAIVVQRLNEKGQISGQPFKVGTLASAIVEKMNAATADDFPAIAQLLYVDGKFGKTLVMQHVGDVDPSGLLDEFNIPAERLAELDKLRDESERIPI